ncbi:MAG: hypothetical protein V4635_16660 [Bacteroidota bacterium]
MARYSRVALYHKAQNAAHNQANKLKQTPVKKAIVQIPEAKNTADPLELIHQAPVAVAAPLPQVVEVNDIKNEKEKKPRSRANSKKMSTPASKIKKVATTKKASTSKTKRAVVKAAVKKTTKKIAKKKTATAKSTAKKVAPKKKTAKKMMTKKMSQKKSAKPAKKTNSRPANKKATRKSK